MDPGNADRAARRSLDHPSLRPQADVAYARNLIAGHDLQARMRGRMLDFLDRHPRDGHLRSCLEGHLTASALLVDSSFTQVLLLHHRKLGRWLQPGGHCDGDANLPAVALRECVEETGIAGLEIDPLIVDLDIHRIPARPGEPEHDHLDTRFVVVAPPGAEPQHNHEALGMAFFPLEEALRRAGDDSLRRLIRRVF
jgi:8-oxo-dGTP pyrophosphatase MutT (NUDIX family)